jgi:endonuclease/exonuclease/phosphatase family metal-dependent hydrolase
MASWRKFQDRAELAFRSGEMIEPLSALQPMMVNRRSPKKAAKLLKVVAFNAKGGRHLDGIRRCLTRPPLTGANVILLCDADWCRPRSGFRRVAAELAASLEMSFAFVPKQQAMEPGSYSGNAILSSQPLLDVVAVSLSKPQLTSSELERVGESHGMLAATVFNGRRITFGVAHLTARWNPEGRERQMADFIAAVPADGPVLIGGDFNTTTIDLGGRNALLRALGEIVPNPGRFRSPELHEPLFQHLKETGFDVHGFNLWRKPTFTYARVIPPFLRPKLDWLAARQLSPVPGSALVVPARQSILGRRFSDHDFVMCEVQL